MSSTNPTAPPCLGGGRNLSDTEESFFVVWVNWTFKDVQAAAAMKHELIFILITNQKQFCFPFTDDEKCEEIFYSQRLFHSVTDLFLLSLQSHSFFHWSSFPFICFTSTLFYIYIFLHSDLLVCHRTAHLSHHTWHKAKAANIVIKLKSTRKRNLTKPADTHLFFH